MEHWNSISTFFFLSPSCSRVFSPGYIIFNVYFHVNKLCLTPNWSAEALNNQCLLNMYLLYSAATQQAAQNYYGSFHIWFPLNIEKYRGFQCLSQCILTRIRLLCYLKSHLHNQIQCASKICEACFCHIDAQLFQHFDGEKKINFPNFSPKCTHSCVMKTRLLRIHLFIFSSRLMFHLTINSGWSNAFCVR